MEPKPLRPDQGILPDAVHIDGAVDHSTQLPETAESLEQLTVRRDQLRQDINRQLGTIVHTPQYEAIDKMSDDPSRCYDYEAIYSQSAELLVRANSAMPNEGAPIQSRTVESLYDELDSYFPTLRYHAAIDFVERTNLHVMSTSPRKRERVTLHPEKWNYAALAKKCREEFQELSVGPILRDFGDYGHLIGALDMAALYSLLSKPDGYPESKEAATAAAFDFSTKLLKPIIETKFYHPDNKNKVNTAILGSYTDALAGPVVDFSALQKLNEIAGSHAQVYLETALIEQMVANVQSAYTSVVDLKSMRDRVHQAQHAVIDNDPERFIESAIATLATIDKELVPALDTVNGKIARTEQNRIEIVPAIEHVEQLNWEILPPGDVERIAREIVREAANETQLPTIDLARLTILDNIRQRWGSDDCYYARGALAARRYIQDDEATEANQYLMLILQEKNGAGELVAEHAIAESPIAGPHALYVFRQDVSEGLDWRDVMSLPKKYARDFGARNVKHTLPRGETDLVSSMTEKVSILMSATAQEFRQLQFDGTRGLRIPRSLLKVD